MQEFADDKSLLAWVVQDCQRHLAADAEGKDFLRRNGVTAESAWTAYRVGTGDPALLGKLTDSDKQRLHKLKLLMWNGVFNLSRTGVCVPTYDPRQPEQPVGIIRCAAAQNKHHFATTPAGVGCTADVDKYSRIILCPSPLLSMRLTELGSKGVVIVESPEVLKPLIQWLQTKELVITAYKKEGLEALQSALSPLKAELVQIQPEIWKSAVPALTALGLKREELHQPPPPAPMTAMFLNELVEYAQGRLKVGVGIDALKHLGADNPEFVEVYGLGYLPSDFRAALRAEDKRKLSGEKIASCVIMPALDEQGQIADVFAVHPNPKLRSNIALSENLSGLIASKVATSFDEIIATDSFRLAAKLFNSGNKNTIFLRGLDDTKLNVKRIRSSGVRRVKVLARRDAEQISTTFEAVGIAVERIKFPLNIADINADEVLHHYSRIAVPKPVTPAPDAKPDPTGITVVPSLKSHDPKTEQAVFGAGEATYTVECGLDTGTKLEVRIERELKVHLDRFDLASEPQRKRFATGAALKTGVPFEIIESHLILILDEIRAIQDRLLNPAKSQATAQMDAAEREAAIAFLKRPDVLDAITLDMEALGWVGEDKTKRLLYLVAVSRKLPKPLSAALMASSGAGKSKGIETVAELAPPEDVIHVSRLTDSALYYHDRDALRHKLLIIDEADALTREVLVALRVLQTRGALTQSHVSRDPATNSTSTHLIEARGPVSVITSSACPLEEQTLSRCYQINIDESVEQTQRILEAQRKQRSDPEFAGLESRRMKTLRLHRNLQRLLVANSVLIPFANRIEFPISSIKHRRAQERFLNLIEASALLHQQQRLKRKNSVGEELIIADEMDFAIALQLASESIGRECDDLSANARDVLQLVISEKLTEFDVHTLKTLRPDWTRHKFRAGVDELRRLDVIASPRRTCPRRYRLAVASIAFLKVPAVRLLPAPVGELAGEGETGFANSSPVAAIS